ncbi:mediator of RNA polymerase-like protein II transcription subunit 16 [Mollisia scopiformis]|uniref:Mediator of RNA polymerase II transcription subunit 16 n=1 Tax=Mollisia scopiformis TaxID=149040 RepID=A0A194XJT6_MOLSC|nr:mediator of RNA polymerase-like protein II transcription subunit 16 [Mollisia scopiformis]KUJ20418.1 mediator of RNA polymeras-like protein II transcription subunit 16 [Mollisia scopiformis]
MPMIMDDDALDMELFGGGDLSLPARPPPKELYQRLDELRESGCCQSIAWSKWGSIASITANGTAVDLRNLRCHPEDGTWALSEPYKTENFSNSMEGGPLKHLAWAPNGSDLAAIDAAGRVAILSVFSSLNKVALARMIQADPTDDLHAVVGSYWLNLATLPPNRPTILNGPAVKDGTDYRYEASQAPSLGPSHPNHNRSAFIFLTTNGLLRLLFPQNNNKWYEVHTELESIVSSDDLITHAAICADKNNTLLIAFATSSKQLRTVRAVIEWNQPKMDKAAPAQLPVQPQIKTRHLAVTSWYHEGPGIPLNPSHVESSMQQLSRLEFLPPCVDAGGKVVSPTIITFRSHLPISSSHFNQDVYTTVDRWEVRDKHQNIHPAFEQLSSRRNSVGSQPGPTVFLKKIESFTVNKIAIGLEPMNHGKVIFFAYSDGSIEYRDRFDMSETFNDGNLERVWHLSQIGFTYPEDEPCLQIAFSPSYCSIVQLKGDGKVQWQHLDYRLGDLGTSAEDPMYGATIAALSLSIGTAVMRGVNYDDLLATVKKHATPQLIYDLLTDTSRIFKLQADYSEESHHDMLVRNTSIQLCLCLQNSLGFKGEFNPRTFSGRFSWLVLQLRNIVVCVSMAANLNPMGPDKVSPLEDSEVINSLTGSVRWILDLMAWLVDTLLTLPTTVPSTVDLTNASKLSLPDLLAHLHSTNTVALHMLLSSSVRGFLTAICRRLVHLDYIARKAIMLSGGTPSNNLNQQNPSQSPHPISNVTPALRQAYLQIATLTSTTIVKVKTAEALLSSLSSLIKTAYATPPTSSSSTQPVLSGSPQAEKVRNQLEIKMLFGSSFPDAFKTVIVELFRKEGLLETVQEEIEPAQLFFADFTMLEIDEDHASVKKRKNLGRTMDCFLKTWLRNPPSLHSSENGDSQANGSSRQGVKWRRCARCAAVMEDSMSQRPALAWLMMQQRRCFCSGYWDTLPAGQMAA